MHFVTIILRRYSKLCVLSHLKLVFSINLIHQFRFVDSINLFQNNVIFCILSDQFEGKDCAVCLKCPEVGDITHKLPCAHKFHKNCIVEWLKKVK